MKHILGVLILLCLPLASFGQLSKLGPSVGKALATKQPAAAQAAKVSSKVLKANYLLTNQSIQLFQQIHMQKVANVFADTELEAAVAQSVVEQMQQEAAVSLAALTAKMDKEYAQWADALLRERNPNFLPKKDPSIPGLLALSPDPKQKIHITPRFFREWAATIPAYEELPEEVAGLIAALRKRLIALETDTFKETRLYMKARSHLNPVDDFNSNRYYQKQMAKSNRALLNISKESAQCVADLVYLLNLYPSLFKDSLTLLAAKLDHSLQTEFTAYLRRQIDLPPQKENISRPVGFQQDRKQPPVLTGKTFNGFY